MTLDVIINLVVCACAFVGFSMGVHAFFKKNQPLYSQMVTIALGCAALGRLYNAAVIVCDGSIPRTFNTGILATVGSFLFFFSANFGQMDSLCDMDDKKNLKFRWIALAAPLLLAVCAVLILFFCNENFTLRVISAVQILVIMLAAYYNCKHLMIHDVDGGIIGSIRGYNLIALLLEFLFTAEITFDAFSMHTPLSIVCLLMCICLLLIIPVLKKGGSKWKA